MNPSQRIVNMIGKALNVLADLIPEDAMDVFERSFDEHGNRYISTDKPLSAKTAERLKAEFENYDDDGGEAIEPFTPRRTVQALGPDERDAQWVSAYGTRWRWSEGRWWSGPPMSRTWVPTPHGYAPASSGPFTEIDEPEMDWMGWAVPAIQECLNEHFPFEGAGGLECCPTTADFETPYCVDHLLHLNGTADWIEHIAPKIAARIGCDPRRAIEALSRYEPDRVAP